MPIGEYTTVCYRWFPETEDYMAVKKRGKDYVVTDSSGKKTLGKHRTRTEAVKQLAAIEASKKRRRGT